MRALLHALWAAVPPPLRWGGAVLVLLAALGTVEAWWEQRADARLSRLEALLAQTTPLSDSTVARIAAQDARLQHLEEHLQGVLEAARSLNGTPVAGFAIRVPKRDTVIVHDTLVTTAQPDSTRVATFQDSTFAGTIRGTVVAPPFPAPLILDSLQVTRPEFRPQVGIVQVGKAYVATVTWQGEQVEVEAPFFNPAPVTKAARARRVVPWAEATYGILGPHELRAGLGLTLQRLQVSPMARQRFEAGARTEFGVTGRWTF